MGPAVKIENRRPWQRWYWVCDPSGNGGGDGRRRVYLFYVSSCFNNEQKGKVYRHSKLAHSRVCLTHDLASQ